MNTYNVTFDAKMDECDFNAMNDLFEKMMDEEMHIECTNLQMNVSK